MNSNKHILKINKIKEKLKEYNNSKSSKKIGFYHGGTNSTRKKETHNKYLIDTSDLNEVISIDKKKKIAIVEPNVSMRSLVKTLQKEGLIPLVVPEFPEITVGGAIQGAALESSSFKYGQFSDNCLEYEIIDGKGNVLLANKENNSDLFYGISGSYGSFGVLTKIKIKLKDHKEFVRISIKHFKDQNHAMKEIKKNSGDNIDFLEGIIFSKTDIAVIIGKLTTKSDQEEVKFSGRFDNWFYLFVKENLEKERSYTIPTEDYFFRYDRGAFWMGDYSFKIMKIPGGNNTLSRAIFNYFFKTKNLYRGLHYGNFSNYFIIQDIYFPFEKSNRYLNYSMENLKIFPIWLCPIKSTKTNQKLSPHFGSGKMMMNIGLWGQPKIKNWDVKKVNKEIEKITIKEKGRKMLYAHQFYSNKEFWNIYDKKWYEELRKKYSSHIFQDIYNKTFNAKIEKPEVIKGFLKFFFR